MPDVTGLRIDDARAVLRHAGFVASVREGDADLEAAVVLAQEPSAGALVIGDPVMELRTVLPDPPQRLECSGTQHPHTATAADALPPIEGVTRAAAEQAVAELGREQSRPAFLARWDRWAWQRVNGEVQVVPVHGFQVVVIEPGPDCGPVTPLSVDGVPVTKVKGPLKAFAASLANKTDALTSDPTGVLQGDRVPVVDSNGTVRGTVDRAATLDPSRDTTKPLPVIDDNGNLVGYWGEHFIELDQAHRVETE